MITAYRVVEIKNGKPHSLFHGTQQINAKRQSIREIPVGAVVAANKHPNVRSGGAKTGKTYTAGWHVFLNLKDAEHFYFNVLKDRKNRAIIQCDVMDIRPKCHSRGGVWLADFLHIPLHWEYYKIEDTN